MSIRAMARLQSSPTTRRCSFSIHGANNFPFRKEPATSTALPDETNDVAYLDALHDSVMSLALPTFDLAIYLAGADPFVGDTLGRLALSKEGWRSRAIAWCLLPAQMRVCPSPWSWQVATQSRSKTSLTSTSTRCDWRARCTSASGKDTAVAAHG